MKTLLLTLSLFLITAGFAQTMAGNHPEINSNFTIDEDVILMNWKTASEANTSYFVVEFSADGEYYEVMSSIKAKGYSTFQSEYEIEMEVPQDSTFIRIVLVSMEGRRIASSETFNYSNNNLIVLRD